MPFHAMCPGCTTSAYLDCTCPPTFDPGAAGMHLAGVCNLAAPDAAVTCPPGSTAPECCTDDHDHAALANACPGGHADCPVPEGCPVNESAKAAYAAAAAYAAQANGEGEALLAALGPAPRDTCPGGHCHYALEDCTVCRPLVIVAMPGSARLLPVAGG